MKRWALEGLRVVEFGGYAAGPAVGKIFANYGADVVHVESGSRPDGFRLQYPPYKDGIPGLERSGCFALFNDSKLGVTINLKHPEAVALARRLTDWADVIIENMRPGVMAKLGLAYKDVSRTNPGLVMLSTCNMGQDGPRASQPGFGSQLSALAGFCGLTGHPGEPPALLYGPYIDFVAVDLGCAAVLAALYRRHYGGAGCHVDLSQYECGQQFLAAAHLDYSLTGRIARRVGNEDPAAFPHGAYRCRGDDWLVLSCWHDDEFAALAAVIGAPQWACDASFATSARRRGRVREIDAAIGRWAAELGSTEAAELLQQSGVHASPVNTVADVFSDPQLAHRQVWRLLRHPEIGDHHYRMTSFGLSRTPGEIRSPAIRLGEHNELVYRRMIGLDEAAYRQYLDQGVID